MYLIGTVKNRILLCGTRQFIGKARANRKALGGGMRQAGVTAACGIVALEDMTGRLQDDHDNAKYLAGRLNELPGIHVKSGKPHLLIYSPFCMIQYNIPE